MKKMAVIHDKFKITANMLFSKEEQRFISKMTQFQLFNVHRNQVIAEADFDLADYVGVELPQLYLDMTDTMPICRVMDSPVSSELDTSLNSLLQMTDDDYITEEVRPSQKRKSTGKN